MSNPFNFNGQQSSWPFFVSFDAAVCFGNFAAGSGIRQEFRKRPGWAGNACFANSLNP